MIILRQKEFNSKSQKKLREKLEVSKHLNEFRETTGLKKLLENEGLQSDPNLVNRIQKLEDLSKHVHDEIRRNPNRQKTGEPLVEDTKVFLKKVSRSGAPSIEEYERRGGNKKREQEIANRTNRGVKKVRGKKTPISLEERNSPMMVGIRESGLSEKSKEELERRKQERKKSISESNPIKSNKAGEGFLRRNWKKLGKGGKAAVIGVPVAAAAVGTGVAIKKHHDKKKKEQEQE